MESIHKRIKRLREGKKLSQEALAKAAGVKYQSVQEWERDNGTAPSRKRQKSVADALGVSVAELMSGAPVASASLKRSPHDEAVARDAREEILLLLYRGLFSHQQLELVSDLRALFLANQIVRKELGQQPLRGVSNEAVVAAFGKIPPPQRKKPQRARREPGDAMGDFLDDN